MNKTIVLAAFAAANPFDAAEREARTLVENQAKAEKAARAQKEKAFIFGLREGGSTFGLYEEKDPSNVVGKVSRRWPFSMGLVAYDPSREK